jgi:UrcA family protein
MFGVVTQVTAVRPIRAYESASQDGRIPRSFTPLEAVMHRLVLPTLAVLALSMATGAHAEEGVMRVKVGDLNVRSDAGARTAFKRINLAARDFCGPLQGYSFDYASNVRKCRKEMTEKAVTKLDAPLVTALYAPQSATQLARR